MDYKDLHKHIKESKVDEGKSAEEVYTILKDYFTDGGEPDAITKIGDGKYEDIEGTIFNDKKLIAWYNMLMKEEELPDWLEDRD